MRRRDFISLLGGAAAASSLSCPLFWPFAVRAQQRSKLPTIGFLGSGTPAADAPWTTAFQSRHRVGHVRGSGGGSRPRA